MFWLAVVVALGLTGLMWHQTQLLKTRPPRTDLDVLVGAVGHLIVGHGCPSTLDLAQMACRFDALRIQMTFTCLATGESLSTRDVIDIWPRKKDFVVLRKCGNISIILWKPAQVAFGVRNLRIELMSRDPNKIIELMCGVAAKTTPDRSVAGRPLAITPRPDAATTTSPATPEPR